jgi:hypothetical protein
MEMSRRAFFLVPAVSANLPGLSAAPKPQAKLEGVSAELYQWRTSPKFGGGHVLGVDMARAARPCLLRFSREGHLERIPVQIPEARDIIVLDFAISESGEIAVGGGVDPEQAGQYLIRIGTDGRQKLSRTAPYVPVAVGFAPDGNLWTAGHLLGTGRSLAIHQVRQFDREGNGTIVVADLRTSGHALYTSVIASSEDRVGLRAPSGEYFEFALDGKPLGRWDAPEGKMSGFAMDRQGRVVIGQSAGKGAGRLLMLDREAGRWNPIEFAPGENPGWCKPIGFDGDVLVTTNGKIQRRFTIG